IINPFTGYPENNELKSITIISKSSLDGDALSTSLFLLGLEKGTKLIESLDDIDAIFVDKSNNVYISSGLDNNFELTNSSYKIKR
ncbi:MAG: FAD:protein FMN transferase, partial [Clostridiales bacterium]|nr:FAD:protein FMN transferase [Clostridiales bacterium]